LPHALDNLATAERLGVALPDPDGIVTRRTRTRKIVRRNAVRDEVARLEFEQFKHPDDEAERARIMEVRSLAVDQLENDVYNTGGAARDSIGRALQGRVYVSESYDDPRPVWASRTLEEEALADGFEPFLERLTPEQRSLVRLRYSGQETERQIAERLGIARRSVRDRLNRIHESLKKALVTAFIPRPEATS
jgi:RNA polymerase sigma factor (sigma-70 family)